jgi:hypothetical protein
MDNMAAQHALIITRGVAATTSGRRRQMPADAHSGQDRWFIVFFKILRLVYD